MIQVTAPGRRIGEYYIEFMHQEWEMGTVVPFPRLVVRQFTPQMRRTLSLHAAAAPGASPVVFGTDGDGAEFCCLANGLTISWDRRGRLLLTDTASGFVDRGPFQGVDEICLVLAYLAA